MPLTRSARRGEPHSDLNLFIAVPLLAALIAPGHNTSISAGVGAEVHRDHIGHSTFAWAKPTVDTPGVELRPSTGPIGAVIEVIGAGWTTNNVVAIVAHWGIDGDPMQADLSIDDGRLHGTVVIPGDATAGHDQPIQVCAEYGDGVDHDRRCEAATFSVDPELTANPQQGLRRTEVEFTGRWADRAAGKDVSASILWQPGGETVGHAVISPDGTITGQATIPLDAAVGAGAFDACIDVGPRVQCARTAFEVLPPTLDAAPDEIAPRDPLRVTGEGWCCAGTRAAIVPVAAGPQWGVGNIDDNGTLTIDATVPENALDGSVELEVCAQGDCQRIFASVSSPVVPATTTAPTTTAAPTTTTITATTIASATTIGVTTTVVTPAGATITPSTSIAPPSHDRRPSIARAALTASGGAGLLATTLLWRRSTNRRRPRLVGRLVPRPDIGHQTMIGRNGPPVAITAVLEIDQGKSTLHTRRTS